MHTLCLQYGGGRNALKGSFSIKLYIFNQSDDNSIAVTSQTLLTIAEYEEGKLKFTTGQQSSWHIPKGDYNV